MLTVHGPHWHYGRVDPCSGGTTGQPDRKRRQKSRESDPSDQHHHGPHRAGHHVPHGIKPTGLTHIMKGRFGGMAKSGLLQQMYQESHSKCGWKNPEQPPDYEHRIGVMPIRVFPQSVPSSVVVRIHESLTRFIDTQ